jgi:hypothetical protein
MESEVRDLLTEQLKDAYSAEKQALRCMRMALRKAPAPPPREGIELEQNANSDRSSRTGGGEA